MSTADIVFGIFIVLVGIGVLIWYIRQRKARSRAVEAWAAREGFVPIDRNDPRVVEALRGSAIAGFYGRVYDPCAKAAGPETLLFEFAYTVGPTGNRKRVRQSVVAASAPGLRERMLVKARSNERAGRLGKNTSSPTGRDDFDARFEVQTEGGAHTPPAPLLDRLLSKPTPPVIEAGNGWVLIYRPGRLLEPSDLNALAAEALDLHTAMVTGG